MSSESLPAELLELIIGHLAEDALVDLHSCTRVCRSWHRLAIARFYRDIEVNATDWSWSSARCQPPVISAEAFSYLLNSGSPVIGAIRTLEIRLGTEFNKCLTDMAFPPDHRVTSLCLSGFHAWLPVNETLWLDTNFVGITSLDLSAVTIESTSVFARAISQFPLLRRLIFSGSIYNPKCSSDIHPPPFAQPCDLILSGLETSTLVGVFDWAVLDPPRFRRISLLLLNFPYAFLASTLPAHPELGPLVQDIEVSYMGAAVEKWPHLDDGLARLTELRVLRLSASSCGCTAEATEGTLIKLVDVATRQIRFSPRLRELRVRALEFSSTADPSDPYGRERLQRLALDLEQLAPQLQVDITFQWVHPAGDQQTLDTFYESFAAWCMLRFSMVKWVAKGKLAVSTADYVRED